MINVLTKLSLNTEKGYLDT